MSRVAVGHIAMMAELQAFVRSCAGLQLDDTARRLRQRIKASGDLWMLPEPGLHAPGTHLLEIQYLEIVARGHDEIEVARNWLKQAAAILEGVIAAPSPTHSPKPHFASEPVS